MDDAPTQDEGPPALGDPVFVVPQAPENGLPPPLQELLNQPGIPPQLVSITQAAFAAASWQGPLPPSEQLRGYEAVLPGSADRILKMAEVQATHRQSLESVAVTGGARRSWFGLWLGFGISVIVLGVSAALVLTGHDAAGTALGSIDVAALAGVFVVGRVDQRKDRVAKDRQSQFPALPQGVPSLPETN